MTVCMVQTWTWARASDICLVEGHIPGQTWAGNTTGDEAPLGVPTECLRCGATLEAEIEIPER